MREKRESFRQYRFTELENDALKTFFDLAQEYETLDNFYRVVVTVLKEFFGWETRLHLLRQDGLLETVVDSREGVLPHRPWPRRRWSWPGRPTPPTTPG